MHTTNNHAMGRTARQQIIAKLLSSEAIPSQERLRTLLAERGIEATQATISRDLRELGVVKGPGGYVLLGAALEYIPSDEQSGNTIVISDILDRVLDEYVVSAVQAGNIVVLKTPPGHAQVVAVELDRRPPAGIAGTVAGDDTIFVACISEPIAQAFVQRARQSTSTGLIPQSTSTTGLSTASSGSEAPFAHSGYQHGGGS